MNTKSVTAEELRWQLTRVAQRIVDGERLVVTHYGKPRFALVSLEDLAQLEGKPAPAKRPKSGRK